MLMASGAPTQRAVTNTDNGGKNGRIASLSRGKNLKNASQCPLEQNWDYNIKGE